MLVLSTVLRANGIILNNILCPLFSWKIFHKETGSKNYSWFFCWRNLKWVLIWRKLCSSSGSSSLTIAFLSSLTWLSRFQTLSRCENRVNSSCLHHRISWILLLSCVHLAYHCSVCPWNLSYFFPLISTYFLTITLYFVLLLLLEPGGRSNQRCSNQGWRPTKNYRQCPS